ncbi:hemerythrin domain-containing protein [Streptomyces sp. H10-C2]|uniref:hemerythrin domain-containing protein n=1 Tax=unclassified Streptomyces TaxID=2593676 RepID=UPI0024B9A922|nr:MULTISPECIES: hemerythrin domain-containing protein [unclassified Streptomyces]MDJ0346776.1 hemerythrin domain-containing protein [Streptomyces sp. PH10-H1]MDJ0374086.1 hemerythrin domain-containing protein [Streptomyces sp. H10-C2]
MSTERVTGPDAKVPDPHVIAVLLGQHARVKGLFARMKATAGQDRQEAFGELRALLTAHETGEQTVLRPVSAEVVGEKIADARNQEEKEADKALAGLEKMDTTSPQFDAAFAQFEKSVLAHAEHEEAEEFPTVRAHCTDEELQEMGQHLLRADKIHPRTRLRCLRSGLGS